MRKYMKHKHWHLRCSTKSVYTYAIRLLGNAFLKFLYHAFSTDFIAPGTHSIGESKDLKPSPSWYS